MHIANPVARAVVSHIGVGPVEEWAECITGLAVKWTKLYRAVRGWTAADHSTGLSTAMNQLPDEAIALAAASHIERELHITPWKLSSNFVACTN
ncbi:hypothetical protein Tco_0574257 [Tanacetum coccineum]